MDAGQLEARIKKLNERMRRMPRLYVAEVVAFAALGYLVYLLVVVLALGLLAGMLMLIILKPSFVLLKLGWKAGVPLLVLIGALFRALRVETHDPQGLPLTRSMAPGLFAIIDRLSSKLRVPSLQWVLVTEEYNAAVTQRPRFGLFGSRNTLLLGFPLLQSLSTEDLTAVLAHEFGHLSGNHGRFTGWLYRAVRSYVALLESTGNNRPLERFLEWYVPRLSALTFPLRRQNEYEADAVSAEVVGARRAAQALTNVHVRGALEGEFWRAVQRKSFDSPHPPASLFLDWEQRVQAQPPADAREALKRSLEEVTGSTDTHPSLADRLQKLAVLPEVEDPPATSAARELLGAHYIAVAEQAGYRWSAKVHKEWQEQYESMQDKRQRLATLEQRATERALTPEEAFARADLNEDVHPDADPLPLFRAVLELDPQHSGARFSCARVLLLRDDAAGVELMKPFETGGDPRLRSIASALLSRYYERTGNRQAAADSLTRAEGAHAEQVARERAREELNIDDEFVPHGLSAPELAAVASDLALFPGVKLAYLVRKVVAGDALPSFVIAIEPTLKARALDEASLPERIVEALTLPGPSWCLRLDQNPRFKAPLSRVEGSLVFRR